MRLKKFLNEKTFDIDKDVDYIFKKAKFDELIKWIKNKEIDKIDNKLKKTKVDNGFEFLVMSSNELSDDESKLASEIKPVIITVGMYKDGSYYEPGSGHVQISLNLSAFNLLNDYKYNQEAIKNLIKTQYKRFSNEFTPANIKGSIAHEITHWIDDVLRDSKIEKKIKKAQQSGKGISGKWSDVNKTEFEVNSQIHAIKVLKKELGNSSFNKLDWENLLTSKTSLVSNFKGFRNKKEYQTFIRMFIKRLNRENLLSRKMKNVPSWQEMKNIISRI